MPVISNPQSPDNEAIRELGDEMKNFNKASKEFSDKSLRLARVMTWLTVILLIGLIAQILLAISRRKTCTSAFPSSGKALEQCVYDFNFGVFGHYYYVQKDWHYLEN